MPTKRTYSQSEEDVIVYEKLKGSKINPADYIYIDIGANQPTQLSNTYFFYRLGYQGIVIEPNRELANLFTRIRQRDVFLNIGCSDCNGIGEFVISESSVVSGFHAHSKNISDIVWVPLLTVDEIWATVGKRKKIFLMSVDTEGHDFKVLTGATEALKNTVFLIVEVSDTDMESLNRLLQSMDFRLIATTKNNLIWLNTKEVI